jgi:hypothetical protein
VAAVASGHGDHDTSAVAAVVARAAGLGVTGSPHAAP